MSVCGFEGCVRELRTYDTRDQTSTRQQLTSDLPRGDDPRLDRVDDQAVVLRVAGQRGVLARHELVQHEARAGGHVVLDVLLALVRVVLDVKRVAHFRRDHLGGARRQRGGGGGRGRHGGWEGGGLLRGALADVIVVQTAVEDAGGVEGVVDVATVGRAALEGGVVRGPGTLEDAQLGARRYGARNNKANSDVSFLVCCLNDMRDQTYLPTFVPTV